MHRLVEKCLEETTARYLAAMLTHIKVVDEELLERMQRDKDTIIAAFEEHIRPDKVQILWYCTILTLMKNASV